jgi:hypothetical protein
MVEPENLVLTLPREIRADMKHMRAGMATESDLAMEYHSSTIGRGLLFCEVEVRERRIETHLNLAPPDAH